MGISLEKVLWEMYTLGHQQNKQLKMFRLKNTITFENEGCNYGTVLMTLKFFIKYIDIGKARVYFQKY